MVQLPASTVADNDGVAGAADTVVCPVGDVSVMLRGWVDSQTLGTGSPIAESADCSCFGHRASGATDANGLLNIYASAAAWAFASPTAPSGGQLYLSVSDVQFTPNTMGS